VGVFLCSLFGPLVFLGGFTAALGGLLLWGVGCATQDTLLKAVVAGMLPEGRRNLAFGRLAPSFPTVRRPQPNGHPCHILEPYPVPLLETEGAMTRMFTISLAAV